MKRKNQLSYRNSVILAEETKGEGVAYDIKLQRLFAINNIAN